MLYTDGQNHTVKICLQQVATASLGKWWCQVSSAKELQMWAVAGQEASEKRVSAVFLSVTHLLSYPTWDRAHGPSQCWKVLFSVWNSKTELLTSIAIQDCCHFCITKSDDFHLRPFFFFLYISRRIECLRSFENNNIGVSVSTEISQLERKMELAPKSWL